MGFTAFWFLDNKPVNAKWLPAGEKQALMEALADEESERRTSGPAKLLPMLRDPRVLGLLLIYGLIQMSTYGAIFYLPAEVSALMHKPAGLEVGLVTAIPWICALFAVYLLPKAADRWNSHRQLAALTLFVAGCASFAFPTAGPRMGLANAVDCRLRVHRGAAAFLDVSDRVHGGSGEGGRHCADRDREPGGICGPEY